MGTPHLWTVEEANAFVPELATLVGRQFSLAADIERCWKALRYEVDLPNEKPARLLELARKGSARARDLEQSLGDKLLAYEQGWREVQQRGLVVRDPERGLCDFYGCVDGKRVWLCWRYGESSISFYHELDAGFAGRKPLTAETRQRLLN